MLRHKGRGIPPHMLHLYDSQPDPTTELQDDATGLSRVFNSLRENGIKAIFGFRFRKSEGNSEFRPLSARSNGTRERQYRGETDIRDTRWS